MKSCAAQARAAIDSAIAPLLLRYGLALVIGWIGYAKFFDYEAQAIWPLVSTSPFMGWLYQVFSVGMFSILLGIVEVTCAVLLCTKRLSAALSLVGGLIAVVLFLSTLSFLFTAPGIFQASVGGFPHLAEPGEFLIKDVVLLGASLWAVADSLTALGSGSRAPLDGVAL